MILKVAPKKLENLLDVLRDCLKDFGLFFMNEEELKRLEDEKGRESKEKREKYAINALSLIIAYANSKPFSFAKSLKNFTR